MATEKNQPKKVRIFVSRKITLERAEKEAVVLTPGANLVDADVAEHAFVKAHTVEGASDAADAADAALQAKVAEQLAEIAELKKQLEEKDAVIKAYEAAAPKTGNGK